jgi:hypothetical protein
MLAVIKNENRKNDTIITEWIPPFVGKKRLNSAYGKTLH